jgi:hypothetical protein
MRMSQRLLAFMLVLLYSAALVGACFFIWSLEQLSPAWRSIMIAGVVVGWSWSLTEDMAVDQFVPWVRGPRGREDDRV